MIRANCRNAGSLPARLKARMQASCLQSDVSNGAAISAPPMKRILSSQFGLPVFVHHFPTAIKGFYFEIDKDRPECALGIDLLAPEGYGEIIGGGQRAHSLEYIEKQIESHNLPRESFEWYLDLRRYGSVPHSGFGMGIERTTAWMCGIEHIRETIPFPRMLYRLKP